MQVLWRRGQIVKFHGNVATYGEKARRYEGGIHYESENWQPGKLVVKVREKDLPKAKRGKFGHKGDPYFIAVEGMYDWAEYGPDDMIESDMVNVGQFLNESFVLEIKLPE